MRRAVAAALAAVVTMAVAPGAFGSGGGPAPPVRCGAVERPGMATRGGDGQWRGAAVDICRASADAAYGAGTPIEFHGYDGLAGLAAAGQDGIAFLSAAELAVPALRGRLRPGPVVTVGKQVLLVPAASGRHRREDVGGRMVCFIVGSAAEDALDAWAQAHATPVEHLGFQEPDEMRDGYAAGKCAALAIDGEEVRWYGPASRGSVVIAEPLAALPIHAATPVARDGRWTGIVADAVRQWRGGAEALASAATSG